VPRNLSLQSLTNSIFNIIYEKLREDQLTETVFQLGKIPAVKKSGWIMKLVLGFSEKVLFSTIFCY